MSVTFSYPALAATQLSSITLPEPQLNDNMGSSYSVLVHLTRDSNFKSVLTRSDRDTYNTTLEFVNLCQNDRDDLEEFLIAAQGHYILYTDYEGTEWVCIHTDSEVELVAVGPGPRYNVSLTFDRWENT